MPTVTVICSDCQKPFTSTRQRGPAPKQCDECRRERRRIPPNKRREYQRRYRQTPHGKEAQSKYSARWMKKNWHRYAAGMKAAAHARRAKMRGSAVGGDRDAYRAFVRLVQTCEIIRCYWCGRIVKRGRRSIDHIIPIARGGADDIFNLCCACIRCNTSKHSKLPEEFTGQFVIPFAKSVAVEPRPVPPPLRYRLDISHILKNVKLTRFQRAAMVGRFQDGYTIEELAEKYGCQPDAIRHRLWQAKKRVVAAGLEMPKREPKKGSRRWRQKHASVAAASAKRVRGTAASAGRP